LIDEFTFAKAQAILAERGEHAKRRGNASDFILSGLLRCGKCGKAYIGMSANGNGGRYHYYACSGRQEYGPKHATANASHARRSSTPSSTSSSPSTATRT
jgi:Recombinase zinc beta ribbon domain